MVDFVYDQQLAGLLSSIEATLVSELPGTVARLSPAEPCYALFLWYTDSCFEDHTVQFGFGTLSALNACAKRYGDDHLSRIDCTWRPQQVLEDHDRVPYYSVTTPGLSNSCNLAYSLMLDANKSPLPLPDEGEILMPYRSMMRRVAERLSKHDWTGTLQTTDTFVVVALHTSGDWLDEDLKACIPRSRFAALKQLGMLAT